MKEGMKMPGFTAETSLYKPRRHYNLGVNRGVDGQVITPQAMKDDDLYPTGCFWSVSKGIKLGSVLVGLLIAIVRIISVRKDTKGLVNINVMTTERFIDESENKEKFKDIPLFINYFYI